MFERLLRGIKLMELEEQILHVGSLLCLFGVFLPWFGGQWYGTEKLWSGFGFYTAYIGFATFLLQLGVLSITLSPMVGGPILVRKQSRNYVRLLFSAVSFILLLSALSVLVQITNDTSGADIRFGIIISLIGSGLATLYCFLRYHEQVRSQVHELFHHPDHTVPGKQSPLPEEERVPPPPPPPPPLPPEDHHPYSSSV